MSGSQEIRFRKRVPGWAPRGKAVNLTAAEREAMEFEALALGEAVAAHLATTASRKGGLDWSQLGRPVSRAMTDEERRRMERQTLELGAEIDAALAARPPRPTFHERRQSK